MKSCLLFRQSGVVIPTRPHRLAMLAWQAFCVIVVVLLLALVFRLDDRDRRQLELQAKDPVAEQHEADLKTAYAMGMHDGRTQMVDSARSIWQACLNEGREACLRSLP